jgi:hypothetical protein
MLNRRLQILLHDEQYSRLEEYAKERGLSVGATVRDAIDRAIPTEAGRRGAAARAILAAEPMPVGSIDDLKRDLDQAHARHLS